MAQEIELRKQDLPFDEILAESKKEFTLGKHDKVGEGARIFD